MVLTVIYAIYNEGYVTTAGELSRFDLSQEALRLARVVVRHVPDHLEATGLLALLLLLQARRPARIGQGGRLVPLPEQDRSLWDATMIAEGTTWSARCWPPIVRGRSSIRLRSRRCTATRSATRTPTGPRS